jgi:hypothetical protein
MARDTHHFWLIWDRHYRRRTVAAAAFPSVIGGPLPGAGLPPAGSRQLPGALVAQFDLRAARTQISLTRSSTT